jgi:hypothetical protein
MVSIVTMRAGAEDFSAGAGLGVSFLLHALSTDIAASSANATRKALVTRLVMMGAL